jgi:hypothetical protein
MQKFLEISHSGVYPCKLWRHWGAGWVSFTLVILGFVKGGFNLLPGEASSESMYLWKAWRETKPTILTKGGFVEFKRLWAELSNMNSWGLRSMGG